MTFNSALQMKNSLSKRENSGITFGDCEKIIREMPRMKDSEEEFKRRIWQSI